MRIKLDAGAFEPVRGHADDAGLDLRSPVDVVIPAQGGAVIHTGVHVELPTGTAGLLVAKSGLNMKHSITSTGLIDAGYSGEVIVKMLNHGGQPYKVSRGDKITQLMVVPVIIDEVEIVDEIESGERGADGFGSTGK